MTWRRIERWMVAMVMILGGMMGHAAVVVRVAPLTNRVVMVHFDDGHIDYHRHGDYRNKNADTIVALKLDHLKAMRTSSYSLISKADEKSDNGGGADAAYATATHPTKLSRKSRPTDMALLKYWDGVPTTSTGKGVCEHWYYLHLPTPLIHGMRYTLSTSGLATNSIASTFIYKEEAMRSEAVKVNQIGYLPDAPMKYGYVYHWMGDGGGLALKDYEGNRFTLIDQASGKECFAGRLAHRAAADNSETSRKNLDTPYGNYLGAAVYECNFTAFTTPGRYRLVVEGIGCSYPFEIGDDIYRAPFRTTMRGLYHNRSGIALTAAHTYFTRPAPHNPHLTPGFKEQMRYTTIRSCDLATDHINDGGATRRLIEKNDRGAIETWGFYQDAGDWDGYPSHGIIPAHLMLCYEMAPTHFTDGELGIPQAFTPHGEEIAGTHNGIPDILDEARWLIEYYHRTRHAILDAGYGTGGVGGARVMGDLWGDNLKDQTAAGSWQDNHRRWYVMGEDPMTTYWYAALAAHYAYLMAVMDKECPTTIDWEQEAVEAYEWAETHTLEGDEQRRHARITLQDARRYAAAALYKLTGKNRYHARFLKDCDQIGLHTIVGDDALMGIASYLLMPPLRNADPKATTRLCGTITTTAHHNVYQASEQRACRNGGALDMPMTSGQGSSPWLITALCDMTINGSEEARAYALTTLDYCLGTNPLCQINFTAEREELTRTDRRYVRGGLHLDSWYNLRGDTLEVPGLCLFGPYNPQLNTSEARGYWESEWCYSMLYPTMQEACEPREDRPDNWPGHEMWFGNRYAPRTAEFTVHRNTVHWAAATGFFCAAATTNPLTHHEHLAPSEPLETLPDTPDLAGAVKVIANGETHPYLRNSWSNDELPKESYGFFYPSTIAGETVDNPLCEGRNTTPSVLRFTRTEGYWRLLGFEPKAKEEAIDAYRQLRFFYHGEAGLLEVRALKGHSAKIPVAASDRWVRVAVDLPTEGISSTTQLFVDPTRSEAGTHYFDEFEYLLKPTTAMPTIQSPDEAVLLYPNPATAGGTVAVELPSTMVGATIILTTSNGTTIAQRHAHGIRVALPLPDAPGIYFVTVRHRDMQLTRKLVLNAE